MAEIAAGDKVVRMIAGEIPMRMLVTDVDELFVYCTISPDDADDIERLLLIARSEDKENPLPIWKFNKQWGFEVDEDIGWGLLNEDGSVTPTGSFLTGEEYGYQWEKGEDDDS